MASETPFINLFSSEVVRKALTNAEKVQPTISARVPKSLYDEISKIADENGITVTAVVKLILTDYFETQE